MSELPAPFTPADCDLQDFAFMPLDVARLRDSDLASDETPEACWAAVLLWCASWHQVPAGSIPDNENWIAKQAGYAQRGKIDKGWQNIRAGALRGWVKCTDGRLYHLVVAEKAKDAWQAKCEQRWRSECGRIKKHNQRHKTNIPLLDFVSWTEAGRPQGQPLLVPEDNGEGNGDKYGDNASKRQGEGQGQRQGDLNNSVPTGTGAAPPTGKIEKPKSPEEMAKAELWRAAKSILMQATMPADQCGTFVGKLCKDYGDAIAMEAIGITVSKQPADPAEFMKATCQRLKGEKKTEPPWWLTDRSVQAKGVELGLPARAGESMTQYKARLEEAIAEAAREKAPA